MALNQSSNQDSAGSTIIAGEGTAGTPVGGVVSTQIVSPLPAGGNIIGVVDAQNGTASNFNAQVNVRDGSGNSIGSTASSGAYLNVTTKFPLVASGPLAATVGTTSAQVLAANTARQGAVFTNTSLGIIYFGIGATAVVGSGITLYPGGVWVMDEFNFTQSAINAISTLASSNLAIEEFT